MAKFIIDIDTSNYESSDDIEECKNYICDQLNIESHNISEDVFVIFNKDSCKAIIIDESKLVNIKKLYEYDKKTAGSLELIIINKINLTTNDIAEIILDYEEDK